MVLYYFQSKSKTTIIIGGAIFLLLFFIAFPVAAQVSQEESNAVLLFLYRLFSNKTLSSFLAGIIFASLVYILFLIKHPVYLYPALFKAPSATFVQMASRDVNGTFLEPFSTFKRRMDLSRKTFFSALLTLVIQIFAFIIFSLIVLQVGSDESNAKTQSSARSESGGWWVESVYAQRQKLTGGGICTPGSVEIQACGNCGKNQRRCNLAGFWGEFSTCAQEGQCTVGSEEVIRYGDNGRQRRTCDSSCQWSYNESFEPLPPQVDPLISYNLEKFRIVQINSFVLQITDTRRYDRQVTLFENMAISVQGVAPVGATVIFWAESPLLIQTSIADDKGLWTLRFPASVFGIGKQNLFGYFVTSTYASQSFVLAEISVTPAVEEELVASPTMQKNVPTTTSRIPVKITAPRDFSLFFPAVVISWKNFLFHPVFQSVSVLFGLLLLFIHVLWMRLAVGTSYREVARKFRLERRAEKILIHWGSVYDSITKQPLPLSKIMLVSEASSKVIQKQCTDMRGRYSFDATPGRYSLRVEKIGYRFPSELVKQSEDVPFVDLYHDEIIEIQEENDVVSFDIPLDPHHEVHPEHILRRRVWLKERYSPVSLFFTGLSFFQLFVSPWLVVLFLLQLRVRRVFMPDATKTIGSRFGLVLDSTHKKAAVSAVIRLFDATSKKLLYEGVTDSMGRYFYESGSARIFVTIHHPRFTPFSSDNLPIIPPDAMLPTFFLQ